eukprot:943139_1
MPSPLLDLNIMFGEGAMLVASSTSTYYLVADANCVFTLFGGYKMWSQQSTNCTIAGLPIMNSKMNALGIEFPELSDDESYQLDINDAGYIFLEMQDTIWSRRTPCDVDQAFYYYSMNQGYFVDKVDNSIYSLDCQWSLILTATGHVEVTNPAGQVVWSRGSDVESLVFDVNGSLVLNELASVEVLSEGGADFLVFDEGKLLLIDHDEDVIIQQFSFEHANCSTAMDPSMAVIKYFYFMKPGDILWNGQALVSTNCQYKLVLRNGNLFILNATNEIIWSALDSSDNAITKGSRFEFHKDGNMVLHSYSAEQLWETETSTLLKRSSIYYADRAILKDNGQFFIIDDDTLTVHYANQP